MNNFCKCGSCGVCRAYSTYEADLEFGGGKREGKDARERMINLFHHLKNEEICSEFGTHGTTIEQRMQRFGPMPSGEDIARLLSYKDFSTE